MKSTPYDSRAGGIAGDMSVWLRSVQEDNEEQLSRLRRNLRRAREQELTPRQRQMLAMYYDEGKTMHEIAAELGVVTSTVSRTICRAKKRLYRCLRYGL